jgi:hypothetical protein
MKSAVFKIGNVPDSSSTSPSDDNTMSNSSLPLNRVMNSDSYIYKKVAYKHVDNIFYFIE